MPDRDRKNTPRPDAFDYAVDYLMRELLLGSGFSLSLPPEDRIAGLAGAATILNVPYERFIKAAHHVLGEEKFSPQEELNLRRQFREAQGKLGGKVSLADLKAEGQEKQPERQKSRDKGMER